MENSFRAGNQFGWHQRNHVFTAGAEVARLQLNGRETLNHRGYFAFNQNFGRSAVENFLYGTPTFYKVGIGDPSRGFRNLVFQASFGDVWRLSARWHLNAGLLYGLETAPHEVSNRTSVPYHCNCTNFSPRFGFAVDEGRWGVFRGGYILSYGQIIPATYQQARFNPPGIVLIEVQNPSLTQPLQGIDLNPLTARSGLFCSIQTSATRTRTNTRSVGRNSFMGTGRCGSVISAAGAISSSYRSLRIAPNPCPGSRSPLLPSMSAGRILGITR